MDFKAFGYQGARMIDSHFRSPWQVALIDPLAKALANTRIHPDYLTLIGLVLGLLVIPALYLHLKFLAISLLLLSALLDILDGSLARRLNCASDRGCILDIICDRAVEAGVVIGLYLYEPATRGLLLIILLSSFYLCVSTFLLSGIFSKNESHKSFHYSPGLIERAETFIFFPLVIIWDGAFFWACIIFSTLVYLTALVRLKELLQARPQKALNMDTAASPANSVR